jgi:DNA mismatch endonuclease (patch repair protein)
MLPQVWLLTAAATVRPWRREGENLPEGQVERFRREAIVWRPPPGIRCRLTDGRQAVVCGPHIRAARVGRPSAATDRLPTSGPGSHTQGRFCPKLARSRNWLARDALRNCAGSPWTRSSDLGAPVHRHQNVASGGQSLRPRDRVDSQRHHNEKMALVADTIDARRRSEIMSRIRSRDTLPEIAVRQAAHALGLRFRLYRRDLPGCPDLVFPRRKLALFVHGCYWHQHPGCRRASRPKSRPDYWLPKLARNVARDASATAQLAALGWQTAVIWECQATDRPELERRLLALIAASEPGTS